MIPAGAEPFKSKINAEFSVTLTEDGGYGIPRPVAHSSVRAAVAAS
jgi:hypothetical protein